MTQMNHRALKRCGISLASLVAAVAGLPAAAQTPPQQPAVGQLGGEGPCTKGTRREGFGAEGNYNWLYVPTGTGSPRTGGTCNDNARPVIFIAPGYSALLPSIYGDLIDNMVSNGYMVVFANYTLLFRPEYVYPQVITGYEYATTTLNSRAGNRMDLTNVGIWGHSYGGGMLPWLAQQFASRGWGSNSLWLSSNATSWVFWQPLTGPLDIPAHTRVQVIGYDQDDKVDQRIGIDMFHAFDIPYSQKDFIQIQSQGSYVADHSTPTSKASDGPPNYLDFYGDFRNYQALADCARFNTNCSVDLTFMGTWSDGTDAVPAIVSDDPIDMGPEDALAECFEDAGTNTPNRCGPTS
jgi:hypothetical protein